MNESESSKRRGGKIYPNKGSQIIKVIKPEIMKIDVGGVDEQVKLSGRSGGRRSLRGI